MSNQNTDLNPLTVVTWNILGDQYDRDQRLQSVASELVDVEIAAIQEAVLPQDGTQDTASQLAALAGMQVASFVAVGATNGVSGDRMYTAILTTLEVIKPNIALKVSTQISNAATGEPTAYAAALLKTKTGRLVLVASLHMPWGAQNERYRLQHAQEVSAQIDQLTAKLPKGSLALLTGDFNALPYSDSMRFLRGEAAFPDFNAFWVDAWDVKGEGPGYTNDPASGNTNLIRTAASVGISAPEMLPPRRIDYLLIKGWVYGSAGAPLAVELIGTAKDSSGVHPSDHFGVKATLWDPALN